jgi:hypothetical protein
MLEALLQPHSPQHFRNHIAFVSLYCNHNSKNKWKEQWFHHEEYYQPARIERPRMQQQRKNLLPSSKAAASSLVNSVERTIVNVEEENYAWITHR